MKNILFCTAVFQLALSFSVNAELAKKVPIKDLVIETSNERMPSKKNIDECMKSMCQVFITNADGIKAQQSGVLIGSKIVVTSLHAFEQEKWEGGKKPEAQYSTVRFAEYDETDFEVVQIEPQDAADDLWQSYDVCPTHIDFMILKLKDAPVAVSNGKVAIAKVAWSWGLDEYINKESMPVSTPALHNLYVYACAYAAVRKRS
jgi:hypothetical protein